MQNRFGFLAGALLGYAMGVKAQTFSFTVNGVIPDGNSTGLANVQTVSSAPGQTIADLNVSLRILGTGLGGFNGDLYVSLQHQSGFSVLLNRPGKRTGAPQGYSDNGFDVLFNESATGDIHNYRLVLSGDHSVQTPGPIAGVWETDGRTADPASVLESSPRTASLDSFANLPVNGEWVLFVADLSSGGTQMLDSWGMQITPVPEPRDIAMAGAALLALFGLGRRIRCGKFQTR